MATIPSMAQTWVIPADHRARPNRHAAGAMLQGHRADIHLCVHVAVVRVAVERRGIDIRRTSLKGSDPAVGDTSGVIHRSVMFAAIDNTVTLPGYTRADVAGFVVLRKGLRLQANVENLFDGRYFVNADSNTNISPGFPRTIRLALITSF